MLWFLIFILIILIVTGAHIEPKKINYLPILKYEIEKSKSIAFVVESKPWLMNGVVNLIIYYGDKNLSYFFVDRNHCEGQYFVDNNILNPVYVKGDLNKCKNIWKNYDLILEFREGKYKIEKFGKHYIIYSRPEDFEIVYKILKFYSGKKFDKNKIENLIKKIH